MNIQQVRMGHLHTSLHRMYAGAPRVEDYKKGDKLTVREDMELQMEDETVSVPAGTVVTVIEVTNEDLALDFGQSIGGCKMYRQEVNKHLQRTGQRVESKTEAQLIGSLMEAPTDGNYDLPGRKVRFKGQDPNLVYFRPQTSIPFGLDQLVGQVGDIQSIWMQLPSGVKLYKVLFTNGGDFIVGDTEFDVIG